MEERFMEFLETPLFSLYILPILIFMSRILDVSIGTVRIIMLSKGLKRPAPLFGFFEILIWLIAIRLVLGNISLETPFPAFEKREISPSFVHTKSYPIT
jgi:hypothetical protein